jgi:hypothetical protein
MARRQPRPVQISRRWRAPVPVATDTQLSVLEAACRAAWDILAGVRGLLARDAPDVAKRLTLTLERAGLPAVVSSSDLPERAARFRSAVAHGDIRLASLRGRQRGGLPLTGLGDSRPASRELTVMFRYYPHLWKAQQEPRGLRGDSAHQRALSATAKDLNCSERTVRALLERGQSLYPQLMAVWRGHGGPAIEVK